jgi:hypothetical protein
VVLVDTSIWVDHLRKKEPKLADLLNEGMVVMHPFVLGELACGNLKNRAALLTNLEALPAALPASDEEVLRLIEAKKLWGRGIGWVDAHLLASALLSECAFWTGDERLSKAAVIAQVKPARQ